jgi:hypothetical protein
MVFFKNDAISLDYHKPCLIMSIKKSSISNLEIKQFSMVLKKFYKTTDQYGKPIKFGMIIYFDHFGMFQVKTMQQIGKLFESLKEKSQIQLYGSAIILHKELRYIFNKFLTLFNNDRPISFVEDIKAAKIAINKYINESNIVSK